MSDVANNTEKGEEVVREAMRLAAKEQQEILNKAKEIK